MEYICILILLILGSIKYTKSNKLIEDSVAQEQIKNINEFLKKIEESKKGYFTQIGRAHV